MARGGVKKTLPTEEYLSLNPPEADIVESLVVDGVGLVGVLHQLVHGQGRVVRLHHRVRHLNKRFDKIFFIFLIRC